MAFPIWWIEKHEIEIRSNVKFNESAIPWALERPLPSCQETLGSLNTFDLKTHKMVYTYFDVVDKHLPETSRQHVLSRLGWTKSNGWHNVHALETPPHSIVDTFGLTPVASELLISVTLMPSEFLWPFLNDLGSRSWSDGHFAWNKANAHQWLSTNYLMWLLEQDAREIGGFR